MYMYVKLFFLQSVLWLGLCVVGEDRDAKLRNFGRGTLGNGKYTAG